MLPVQKTLIVVVITLTVLLSFVGLQVVLMIVDLRKAIKRLNGLLGDSVIGGGLIQPDKITKITEMLRRGKKVKERGQG